VATGFGSIFRIVLQTFRPPEPTAHIRPMPPTGNNAQSDLDRYHAKRSAGATPEPSGRLAAPGGRRFVVQKHAATRTHFDLRLEHDGVLKSWAVPKGPSYDTGEKRLAVHVEDHPVEYAEFEGIIPKGNYGAGPVIVWDIGHYLPLEPIDEGFEKGKLLFELRGHKLRGRWTLVKIKKGDNEWLLIKERDGLARPGEEDDFVESSVFSGLTVEELGEGVDPAEPALELLEELAEESDAKRRPKAKRLSIDDVDLMLAERREKPFSDPGWVFELKYDGYRLLCARDGDEVRLLTRNRNDATATFPEIAQAVGRLPFDHVILDGEVVVHDENGLPSFQRLQQRGRLSNPHQIATRAIELPAILYTFDLLALEGRDLRRLPLVDRKRVLREVLPEVGTLRYADHVPEVGEEFYAQVERMQLEGIVAKKADGPYRSGRSADWRKIRADRTEDLVVVGFTEPKGSRGGIGALHLAAYVGDELRYAGRAGSGFTDRQLAEVREELDALRVDEPPCTRAPKGKDHAWVEPELVAEVRFREWTEDDLLRHPVFLRFRDDKPPRECIHPAAQAGAGDDDAREEVIAEVEPARASEPEVTFSNLDKVFWPEEGYTKGDLVEYYRAVADWMVPYMAERPIVLTRYPDGIDGKNFFQKDAPDWAPDWIRTETVWSEDGGRDLRYFIGGDEPTLLFLANSAAIVLHLWASRLPDLERPDWCILDLDPKEAPFSDVVEVAKAARAVCDDLDLPAYVKTSGSSGLHVLVPLGKQLTHDQSKVLAELIARVIVGEVADIATIVRNPKKREGKVYVDFLQNGWGKLLVAPFSARPVPAATVSAPLRWKEVNGSLKLSKFTIKSVPRRMRALKEDPMVDVLSAKPDLAGALARLQERL
jgi:bifunctional non-homologous end joining protein LigD